MLAIKLLGTLQISLNGKNLRESFRTDKERALFIYLVMEAGRTFRREALAELLWPDRPTGTGRTNLRQALLGIRRALRNASGLETYLEIEDESLGFRPDSEFSLDSLMFTQLVNMVRTHQHVPGTICAACLGKLQQAYELYQGELLEGYFLGESTSFQEWLIVQRENILEDYLFVLTMLSEQATASRDYPLGIQYARQLISRVPLDERAHRLLIRLLAESGQRPAALEQFETCQHLLAQELGIEPSQQTIDLYEKIRRGEVSQRRTTGALRQRSNLPVQLTTFAGRVNELRWFENCLVNPICRLITLLGMPGSGKTRLALQVAALHSADFQDGVWLVPVESLQNTDQLIFSIGKIVGIHFEDLLPQRSQLLAYLRDKEMLVVLDGFDQLVSSTEFLLEVLKYAPGIKFLVTTQTRLEYQSACVRELSGLEYPPSQDDPQALEYPAVELFLARAARVRPGYIPDGKCIPDIVRICNLVEGLPLAIELAAAGLRSYSCAQIAMDIENNLDSLRTNQEDVPERHRSIRAALDHAWLRLSGMEQEILAGMTVFEGGFSLPAAQEVIGADVALLSSLSGKSLLQQTNRLFYCLQPLVRSYARERLAQLDHSFETVTIAHCKYYLGFVARYEADLAKGQDLCHVIDEIGDALDNVRRAMTTALEDRQFDPLARAADALIQYFEISSNISEGERYFRAVIHNLERSAANFLEELVLAQACRAVGWYQARRSLFSSAREFLMRAQSILEPLQSELQPGFLGIVSGEITSTLNALGFVAAGMGEYPDARRHFEHAMDMAHQAGDSRAWAYGLLYKTELDIGIEELETLLAEFQRCLHIFDEHHDRRGLLRCLIDLGDTAFLEGNHARARIFYEQAQEQIKPLDTGWASAAISYKLGVVEKARGNLEEARRLNQYSLEVYEQIGDLRRISAALSQQGELACMQGCCEQAADYHDQALRLAVETGSTSVVMNILVVVARCYASAGDFDQARRLLEIIHTHPATSRSTQMLAGNLLAEFLGNQSDPNDDARVYHRLLLSPFIRATVEELLRTGEKFQGRVLRKPDPFDLEIFGCS